MLPAMSVTGMMSPTSGGTMAKMTHAMRLDWAQAHRAHARLAEVAAVLAWLNPAARRLRRWPVARVDPGCARQRDKPWSGRRNCARPNRETPSRAPRRVTFSMRQPVTELREATRHMHKRL